MKKTYRLLLALAPCFALPAAALAQTSAVPPYISYQGTVAAADGTAVGGPASSGGSAVPVNRSVVFRIWSHPTNSALTDLLYSETQVVTIVDGQFSVLIGEGVTTTVGNYGAENDKKLPDIATAFAGKDCYLGVTVAAGASLATSDNEISPRQRIVSTGFAFRAKVAENLIGTASLASGSDFTINPSTLPTGITASNYGLGWYGTGRLFGTTPATVDGPVLYGNSGGALGSSNGTGGTKNLALLWNNLGQVGIGASGTFAAGNKLTLQGDDTTTPASQLSIRGNTDANKRLLLGYNTTSNLGSLQAYSAATTTSDILLNPVGGNIGIGMTTAPTQRLQVNGSVASLGYTFAAGDADGGLFSPADGVITLRTNGTERVRVDASGNVGIGTTAPGFPLNFASVLGDKIALHGGSGNSYGFGVQNSLLQIHTGEVGGDIAFGYGSSAAMTETMRIKGSGAVSITGTLSVPQITVPQIITEQVSVSGRVMAPSLEFWGSGGPGGALWQKSDTTWPKNTTAVNGEMVLMGSPKLHFATLQGGAAVMTLSGKLVGIGRQPVKNLLEVEGDASKSTASGWLANSDRRIKTEIKPILGALEKLNEVRLVDFRYSDDYRASHPSIKDRRYPNVIAQEFAKVFPDDVNGSGERLPDGSEILQVDTYPLTIYTAAAVQQLKREKDSEIQALRDENATLRRELAAKDASLETRLIALERLMLKEGATETVSLKTEQAVQ